MCVRVLLEKTLPLQCNPNVPVWNLAFFDKTMSQDSGNSASKEIQDPIVDPFPTYTEFVDPVLSRSASGRRSSWPSSRKCPDLDYALVLDVCRKGVEPF